MPVALIQTSISLGNIGVVIAVLGFCFTVWRLSPVGGSTVDLLQSQCEALERQVKLLSEERSHLSHRVGQLTEQLHHAELSIKDREKEIERFKAMPDTAKVLETFETYQTATLRAFQGLNTTLTPIAEGIATLVARNQNGRIADA